MTGPEHYRRAEKLLAGQELGGDHPDGSPVVRQGETEVLLAALTHAVLGMTAQAAIGTLDRTNWLRAVMTDEELTTHAKEDH